MASDIEILPCCIKPVKYSRPVTVASCFFMLSFLVVTIFKTAGLVFIGLLSVIMLLDLTNKNKVTLTKEDTRVFGLFYIVHFVSLSLTFINIIIHGIPYIEFYPSMFGRIINSGVYALFFVYIMDQRNKDKISVKKVINGYLMGCCILLAFGLWQLSSLLFNIPYPDFTTRAQIHSIDTTLLPAFMTKRITSVAEEPAYLIPYLMDAAIIFFFTRGSKIIVMPFVIVLLFTLSLSGYVNLLFVALAVFALTKTNKGKIFFVCLAVPVIAYFVIKNLNIFLAVLSRLNPDDLLKSGRLQEILLPVEYMLSKASPFNLLFGYGTKGLFIYASLSFTNTVIMLVRMLSLKSMLSSRITLLTMSLPD